MDAEVAANIERLLGFLSWGVRFLGMLGLGVTSGWFTMHAYNNAGKAWQVQAAALVAFLYLISILINSSHPAAVGAYAIGASASLLIWGINKNKSAPAGK